MFVQIARAIADSIRSGRLAPGARLPGTRELAAALGLNRNTVTAAFSELQAEGWVISRQGQGTLVSHELPKLLSMPAVAARRTTRLGFDLGAPAEVVFDEGIERGLTKWDFGVPDVRLAPARELARAYRRALEHRSGVHLQYTRYRIARHSQLQMELAKMLGTTRGINAEPAEVVITHGSQMALYLVARSLLRPHDVVAVENPGFAFASKTFEAVGARVVPVKVDASGLEVDQLEKLVQRGVRLRAVFLTPHHQFPTTVALSPARRIALLHFAAVHRVAVIEDDYDHEFHYQGRPLLPLASVDQHGTVIYIGSLSKIFAPGIRVGYVVSPPGVSAAIRAAQAIIDPQGNQPLEAAVAELIEDGILQRHLNRARKVYHLRRDRLVALLQSEFGDRLTFTTPSGGMALWVKVSAHLDVEACAARSRADGLLVRTGRRFFLDGGAQPYLRLGFARFNERELEQVVHRLRRAFVDRPDPVRQRKRSK